MSRGGGVGRRALVALLFALLPSAARAQGWVLDASAGRAVYGPLQERIGAVNVSLGLRYAEEARRWASLSGGVDLAGEGPGWAAAGAGRWVGVERGPLSLGATLSGQLFGYTATRVATSGGGAVLEVIPTAVLRRGALEAELRAGVVQTVDLFAGEYLARSAFDGGGRVLLEPVPGLRAGGEGRYLRTQRGGWPYAGATVQLDRRWGSAWASAGRWLTSDPDLAPYSGYGAGATLRLAERVEVLGAWRQEPADPLYRTSAQRTWTVRVSWALGRRPGPLELPAPLLPEASAGEVAIRLPRSGYSAAPSVLGDFSGWEPVRMAAVGDFWEVRLPLAPGVYHYGFRTADGEWFVPDSLPRADDGMGGSSAVLVVTEAGSGGM